MTHSDYDHPPQEVVRILPEKIIIRPEFNVRPFSSTFASDAEDKRIVNLAHSLEDIGQQENLRITAEYVCIAGARRRAACLVLNEWRSARGQSLVKLDCTVDRTGKDLLRKAIHSNIQRQNNSPMEFCYLITRLRKEYGWSDGIGTRKLAEYLGIDACTIVAYEKLHNADRTLQNYVHSGRFSLHSALDILANNVTPKEQTQVIQRALEINRENQLDKILTDDQQGKTSRKETERRLDSLNHEGRVKHPAVIQAIREHAAIKTPHIRIAANKLSRKELLSGLNSLDCEGIPPPARVFIRYVVDVYSTGSGELSQLRALLTASFPQAKSKAS